MKKTLFLLVSVLMLTGCGPKSGAQLDSADEKDARVRKGLELIAQKNPEGAVSQFEAALLKKPELGRPDLELAMIYQQQKNYARAIYHYERYLEKRPNTEKRPLIQDWIRQAKISLAAEAGGDVSPEMARLTRENNMLRKQLETLQGGGTPSVTSVKTILSEPPVPRPVQAPVEIKTAEPAKPVKTYTVRTGDTLSRIAGSVYGDSTQWRKIYEANRDQMKNEGDIKIGQTLVIPNLGN